MATNFPEELDSFVNPQPTDSVAIVSHAEQHSNANDAIEALQVKVGKDNSEDVNSLDYRIRALETGSLDPEEVQDLISQLITSGTGISIVYDDENNLLTFSVDTSTIATQEFATQASSDALTAANEYTDIAVAGLGNQIGEGYVPISLVGNPEGVAQLDVDGKVPLSQLDIDESIQDVAAQMITSGTHSNLSVSYDDINGTLSFTALGGGGGGASVTVSADPPLTPSLGDLWLDSDNGRAYAYDGAFWAEIGSGGQLASISTTPPGSAVQGQVWLDSDNGKSYIYDGMYWVEM